MRQERWEPIAGWVGVFEVSDQGRVRRITLPANGQVSRVGRIAKTELTPGTDYRQVGLGANGRKRVYGVHQLVADAFIGPRPHGHVLSFRNGDRADCRAANLVYVTREAVQTRAAEGLRKLTDEQVRLIRSYRGRESVRKIAARVGCPHQTVHKIHRSELYRHVR